MVILELCSLKISNFSRAPPAIIGALVVTIIVILLIICCIRLMQSKDIHIWLRRVRELTILLKLLKDEDS